VETLEWGKGVPARKAKALCKTLVASEKEKKDPVPREPSRANRPPAAHRMISSTGRPAWVRYEEEGHAAGGEDMDIDAAMWADVSRESAGGRGLRTGTESTVDWDLPAGWSRGTPEELASDISCNAITSAKALNYGIACGRLPLVETVLRLLHDGDKLNVLHPDPLGPEAGPSPLQVACCRGPRHRRDDGAYAWPSIPRQPPDIRLVRLLTAHGTNPRFDSVCFVPAPSRETRASPRHLAVQAALARRAVAAGQPQQPPGDRARTWTILHSPLGDSAEAGRLDIVACLLDAACAGVDGQAEWGIASRTAVCPDQNWVDRPTGALARTALARAVAASQLEVALLLVWLGGADPSCLDVEGLDTWKLDRPLAGGPFARCVRQRIVDPIESTTRAPKELVGLVLGYAGCRALTRPRSPWRPR